jgi:hypothetical protein
MCTYNISVNDTMIEAIRPAFPDEKAFEQWLQRQMDMVLIEFAAKQKASAVKSQPLSQRLRGIATAPKDFDYKEELANRYEA